MALAGLRAKRARRERHDRGEKEDGGSDKAERAATCIVTHEIAHQVSVRGRLVCRRSDSTRGVCCAHRITGHIDGLKFPTTPKRQGEPRFTAFYAT
jgi:hypothetical protein